MTFTEFVAFSNYCATHAANCILYKPKSRPAKLAKNVGYIPTDSEKTKLRYLISGRSSFEELFLESSTLEVRKENA